MSDISEQTTVKLTISSWYHVVVLLFGIGSMFFVLMGKIDDGLKLATDAIAVSRQNAAELQGLKMDQQTIKDDLLYFHKRYEDDMDRYIRERPLRP